MGLFIFTFIFIFIFTFIFIFIFISIFPVLEARSFYNRSLCLFQSLIFLFTWAFEEGQKNLSLALSFTEKF